MSQMYELRPVTEHDVPILLRLVKALAEYERLTELVVATADELRRGLCGPDSIAQAVLAWSGDEAVGFAVWYETFSTFRGRKGLYLEDIFVVPEHRGRGLGKALIQHVAAIACQQGCFRLEWEVLRWNTPAIGFYERLGARRDDAWDRYTLSDEALLRLASGRTN
jgi:GNAT superfamily N-acetyltransferase